MANAWMKGADYMSPNAEKELVPGVTQEAFVTDYFPSAITALGVAAIFLANRSRRTP